MPQNVHNSHRCPECDGFGQVKGVETRESSDRHHGSPTEYVNDSGDWHRVKYRNMECRECGNTWQNRR